MRSSFFFPAGDARRHAAMKGAVDGAEQQRIGGCPQPGLGLRGRAGGLTLGEPDHQRGEVAGQLGDLAGAVEGGVVQIQGWLASPER